MAPTTPTATPAAGPNAKPLTMAGMAEASYLSHVTPGSRGNSMNDSSTPMAHRSAMVTSWRVSHLFVFVKEGGRLGLFAGSGMFVYLPFARLACLRVRFLASQKRRKPV